MTKARRRLLICAWAFVLLLPLAVRMDHWELIGLPLILLPIFLSLTSFIWGVLDYFKHRTQQFRLLHLAFSVCPLFIMTYYFTVLVRGMR
jgi:hypothetical protein